MNLSEVFGKTIIDQLIQQGVTDFVLAPGLRSAPLAIALAEQPDVEPVVHFDERGAGFCALGMAKASGRPAAIVVTSGTASSNLMPAVMEASTSGIPLILLTCDRPHELRETGANQTADQVKLFGSYVRFQFDFPRPSTDLPERFIATTIAEGVYKAMTPQRGPVQFNLPFPEPLFGQQTAPPLEQRPVLIDTPAVSSSTQIHLGKKKGVIVIGAGGSSEEASQLAERLSWPIFADIISGHREKCDPHSIPYYHHILKARSDLKVDVVIHIGGPCVSQVLLKWMSSQKEVIHVSKELRRIDPHHAVSQRLASCQGISGDQAQGWVEQWKHMSMKVAPSFEQLAEPSILLSLLDSQDALFFASSMPIRNAEMFFFPKVKRLPLFANRGLSGIDGNIATVCGIANHLPVTALLGDLTALHDINSLPLIHKAKHPVRLIIINNGGGGIFSFTVAKERENLLDTYFAAAHSLHFGEIAKGFGLTYERVDTLKALSKSQATLIEIMTDRSENYHLHKQLEQHIHQRICASSFTVS